MVRTRLCQQHHRGKENSRAQQCPLSASAKSSARKERKAIGMEAVNSMVS